MATKTLLPHIIPITFTLTGSDDLQFAYWPDPIVGSRGTVLTPPEIPGATFNGKGVLRAVTARVPTGGGLTLTDLQVSIYHDLTSYPNGTVVTPATGLDSANAFDERKVYASEVVASPTPSATAADIDDRLDPGEDFTGGIWIVCQCGTVTGSGTTDVNVRLKIHALG